jgi:pilus assembly protein Flp/PilA
MCPCAVNPEYRHLMPLSGHFSSEQGDIPSRLILRRDSSGAARKIKDEKDMYMKQFIKRVIVEDSGQDLIEYALVAALVGLGAVVAMKGLSNSIKNSYNGVGTALTNA